MAEIERKTKGYPTDLTDEEWSRIEPLLPRPGKAMLRRRFLQGGAAAIPLIVTFGRPSAAVAASIDCFVRAGFASPTEAFYDTQSREAFLESLQATALGGLIALPW